MSDIPDPRLDWLCTLDLSTSHIEYSKKPIVLLCGGQIKIKETRDEPEPLTVSLRHAITTDINTSCTYEIFRPEEIQNWHSDGVFKDLINFELELAGVCSLIVVILESEGALVELGAFSQQSDIVEKIIAIKSDKFNNDVSFINHGVLRYLSATKKNSVKSYPWNIKQPNNISSIVVGDIKNDIESELKNLPKTQLLIKEKITHISTLICDIIGFFVALKETEILHFLELIDVKIEREQLKRKLFLLSEFRLIKKQDYSDAVFYMRTKDSYHKFHPKFTNNKVTFDKLRLEMQCLDYYKNNSQHRNRYRAITQAKGGLQ